MKKYDGIFLCSDFDGTLTYNGQIPQNNIDAIKYFSDNGGIFSVVSGRNIQFLRNFADTLCLNSYVACLNGTEIYHMPTGSLVHQVKLPSDAKDRLCEAMTSLNNVCDIHVFTDSGNIITRTSEDGYLQKVYSYLDSTSRKLLVHNSVPFTEDEVKAVGDIFGKSYVVARSWNLGLEISNAVSHKGVAAREMADLSGSHTLICVGNYENDILMLKSADIGYAVGDSLPSLKKVATKITVPAADGAIAAIINEL